MSSVSSQSLPLGESESPQTIHKFAFSSLSDLNARLSTPSCRHGGETGYVVFTSVPVDVLGDLSDTVNRSLKITRIENNTATLIFRTLSKAHGAAETRIIYTIERWLHEADPEGNEMTAYGASDVKCANETRQPDGSWGPASSEEGNHRQRTLIQSHPDLTSKLEFWFNAGAAHVFVFEVPKGQKRVSLQLWGRAQHITRATSHTLVSSLVVSENGTSVKKEGTEITLSLAAVAAREQRSGDINLKITVENLAKAAPKLWSLE
ncbi:hypothetical protein KEM56_006990 [Ascosphaera pollenicola]|nr:hypothetical protein KEM56_006990 [Ascosphaera pollenicola]